MMKRWRRWIGLGLLACTASAETAFIDFEHDWLFPKELGGLAFERAEKYDAAELGYSVFYRDGDSLDAVVSVYTLGQSSIPDGFEGAGIDMVFKGEEDALELRLKQKKIRSYKLRGKTVAPKEGPIRFASTMIHFVAAEGEQTQRLQATYLTGLKGQFIKLQFTFNLTDTSGARGKAAEMITQLVKMLTAPPSDEERVLAACSIFLNDPNSYAARTAAQHVMAYANTKGNLNIYPHLFVWPTGYYSKPKNADLLIVAYLAGMLQVVVPQQLDEGGELEGFVALLDVYETLRSAEQMDAIPKIGEWAKHPDKRALFDELLIVE